jgi:hypothetical protein
MRTQNKVFLPECDRAELETMVRSGNWSARRLTRARLLLLADRSQGTHRTDQQIADALLISPETVKEIRRRYVQGGLEVALKDKPRPGRAPKITGDVEARLIALVCSDPPEGTARWTLRLLADQVVELQILPSISHVAIAKALKKTHSSRGRSKAGV